MVNEYINSKVCQKCAECCKKAWIYTDLKDDAIRFSWLDSDKVSVIQIKEGLWKIIFNIQCKMLKVEDDKYICEKHNSPYRPNYCKEYPANFIGDEKCVIKAESKVCPIIKKVTMFEKQAKINIK